MHTYTSFARALLLAALLAGGMTASAIAQAATANHAEDVVTFKKVMKQPIKKCADGEVLTHVGAVYKCVPNSPDAQCPNGAVQVVTSDGVTTTCEDIGLNTNCPGGVITAPVDGVSGCAPPPPTMPVCGADSVLTTYRLPTSEQILVCLPMTASWREPVSVITAHHGACSANSAVGIKSGRAGFSAWCISGCKRYCDTKQIFGIKLFGGGYVTDYNTVTDEIVCTCVR